MTAKEVTFRDYGGQHQTVSIFVRGNGSRCFTFAVAEGYGPCILEEEKLRDLLRGGQPTIAGPRWNPGEHTRVYDDNPTRHVC